MYIKFVQKLYLHINLRRLGNLGRHESSFGFTDVVAEDISWADATPVDGICCAEVEGGEVAQDDSSSPVEKKWNKIPMDQI